MLGSILARGAKITRVSNAVAAGTTDVECTVIDHSGFDRVLYIVLFGTITATAVTSIKVEQGDESDMSDGADLTGTGVSVADDDDNQAFYLDVGISDRYSRFVVDRGTANAVIDGVIAIQYGSRSKKVTHDATTVGGGEVHIRPVEGTA